VVNLFLWKACNNILPTKANLARRGVTPDDKCPICKLERETVSHSLWSCQAAKDVWSECPMRIQKSPCDEDDFLSIFKRLVERLSVEDLRMLAYVARQIWFRRNGVVFKEVFQSPKEIIQAAYNQMNQYEQAHLKRSTDDSIRTTKSGKGCWTKPLSGVIKINWDAAMDTLTGKAGLGSIARDCEGRVVAMSSSIQQHITNPTTAETLAAWQAVVLGMQLGATYLELEGDALEVVQGLNQVDYCCGRDGPVLNDIKMLF
jgi:hypothetical protein